MFITAGLGLLVANLLDISSISVMGSAGFLLVFTAVNAANLRLHRETDSRWWISAIGVLICAIAFVTLLMHGESQPSDLFVLAGMVGGSFLIETIYRGFTGRELSSKH